MPMRFLAVAGSILFVAGLFFLGLGAAFDGTDPAWFNIAGLGVFIALAGGGMILAALVVPTPPEYNSENKE